MFALTALSAASGERDQVTSLIMPQVSSRKSRQNDASILEVSSTYITIAFTKLTSSSVVAEKPLDTSYLSVVMTSTVKYLQCILLLLVT